MLLRDNVSKYYYQKARFLKKSDYSRCALFNIQKRVKLFGLVGESGRKKYLARLISGLEIT